MTGWLSWLNVWLCFGSGYDLLGGGVRLYPQWGLSLKILSFRLSPPCTCSCSLSQIFKKKKGPRINSESSRMLHSSPVSHFLSFAQRLALRAYWVDRSQLWEHMGDVLG